MQYLLIDQRPDMQEILQRISRSEHTFLKFLSANDLGLTHSHQSGIYMGVESWPMFFDTAGVPGENREAEITVRWENGVATRPVFRWYGASKREYRLTRLRDYFRSEEFLGSLFVMVREKGEYRIWILNHEEEMEAVLNFFGITPEETNRLLRFDLEERLRPHFEGYLAEIGENFPDTESISTKAQRIHEELYGEAAKNPDASLLQLIHIEYALFRFIERERYAHHLVSPFGSIEELLSFSLEINNRRKSRAGKSLELHLRHIFRLLRVPFSHGAVTNEQTRPDFIFPGIEEYNDPLFPVSRLFFLGAKTTCKDRWRQVLNEAQRIPTKYIFTLQQGFSSAQLREMHGAGVIPVVPQEYHDRFREEDRAKILSFQAFLEMLLAANGTVLSLF